MIVKKYIGDSVDEVESLMVNELGPNAIILTSRLVKGKGLKRFFTKNRIEIVAAIEEETLSMADPLSLSPYSPSDSLTEAHQTLADQVSGFEKEIVHFQNELVDWYANENKE